MSGRSFEPDRILSTASMAAIARAATLIIEALYATSVSRLYGLKPPLNQRVE